LVEINIWCIYLLSAQLNSGLLKLVVYSLSGSFKKVMSGCLWNFISQLWGVTCHMGSRTVWYTVLLDTSEHTPP